MIIAKDRIDLHNEVEPAMREALGCPIRTRVRASEITVLMDRTGRNRAVTSHTIFWSLGKIWCI